MSMFAMLLPKRSPAARSGSPMRTAAMSVNSSGADVAAPRKTEPTQSPPSLVRAEIASPLRAREIPAEATTTALTRNTTMAPASDSMPPPRARFEDSASRRATPIRRSNAVPRARPESLQRHPHPIRKGQFVRDRGDLLRFAPRPLEQRELAFQRGTLRGLVRRHLERQSDLPRVHRDPCVPPPLAARTKLGGGEIPFRRTDLLDLPDCRL